MARSNGSVPRCGAKTKSGGICKQPAGFGTPHLGTGACKWHLGNAPAHLLAAASHEARVLGAPIEIEPHDALRYCVYRAAGDIAYYEARIAELSEAIAEPLTLTIKLVEREGEKNGNGDGSYEQRTMAPIDASIWIRLRDQALDRLARYAKMAIDAGIEERQVRVAERMGDHLASVIEALFDALGTPATERVKVMPIVQARLLQLEAPRD